MIRLIEALNYRCLHYVRQPLGPFHVLVGPNASGKSSLLDVPGFFYSLIQFGLDRAVRERSDNILDLIWQAPPGPGVSTPDHFELAIEMSLPNKLGNNPGETLRYCVDVGLDTEKPALAIRREELRVLGPNDKPPQVSEIIPETIFYNVGRLIFPDERIHKPSVLETGSPLSGEIPATIPVLNPWVTVPGRAIPTNVSHDSVFRQPMMMYKPDTLEYIKFLYQTFCTLVTLHEADLRKPSPPGGGMTTRWTGENLPNMVDHLSKFTHERHELWQQHLRTALPDLKAVKLYTRKEDQKQFISLEMKNGTEFPQWSLSEGTLDLLALTILAYLPRESSALTFLVEEPESHIHPLNIEVVFQSLSSVYDGQMLVSTHSPTVLALADPTTVLVFSRDSAYGTRIVRGDQHPRLREWHGEMDLASLYATGVLG